MTSKEAIKKLKEELAPVSYMRDFDKEECLEVIEKELKAFDIIKKKKLDTLYLRNCFVVKDGLEKYNACFKVGYKLKQEEFDFLKEMLKSDKSRNQ